MKLNSDTLTVAAYIAMCASIVILYKQYTQKMASNDKLNAEAIFTHIDEAVDQKLLEHAIAEQAARQ